MNGMGKKILLADDSITIQKVIELTFSDEDFDVVTVGNGRLALERLPEVRPDIVLCDIIMPEKDGYEVCEQIKSNPVHGAHPRPAPHRCVRALRSGACREGRVRRVSGQAVRARDAHRQGQGSARQSAPSAGAAASAHGPHAGGGGPGVRDRPAGPPVAATGASAARTTAPGSASAPSSFIPDEPFSGLDEGAFEVEPTPRAAVAPPAAAPQLASISAEESDTLSVPPERRGRGRRVDRDVPLRRDAMEGRRCGTCCGRSAGRNPRRRQPRRRRPGPSPRCSRPSSRRISISARATTRRRRARVPQAGRTSARRSRPTRGRCRRSRRSKKERAGPSRPWCASRGRGADREEPPPARPSSLARPPSRRSFSSRSRSRPASRRDARSSRSRPPGAGPARREPAEPPRRGRCSSHGCSAPVRHLSRRGATPAAGRENGRASRSPVPPRVPPVQGVRPPEPALAAVRPAATVEPPKPAASGRHGRCSMPRRPARSRPPRSSSGPRAEARSAPAPAPSPRRAASRPGRGGLLR